MWYALLILGTPELVDLDDGFVNSGPGLSGANYSPLHNIYWSIRIFGFYCLSSVSLLRWYLLSSVFWRDLNIPLMSHHVISTIRCLNNCIKYYASFFFFKARSKSLCNKCSTFCFQDSEIMTHRKFKFLEARKVNLYKCFLSHKVWTLFPLVAARRLL